MTDIKPLVFERGQMKARLTRFRTTLEQYPPDGDTIGLVVQLEKIESLFPRFEVIQLQIEGIVQGTNQAQQQAEEGMRFEQNYYDLVKRARVLVEVDKRRNLLIQEEARIAAATPTASFSNDTNLNQARIKLNSKLPVIKLKEFDGSYNNWIKFRDTFKSMIYENPDITKITKFHYLDASLQRDARRVIDSLGVSEANYDIAWQRLLDRYEDVSALVCNHVRALFELKPMNKGSSNMLQQLIDDVQNNLQALKVLNEPTDHWDTIIIFLLSSKLDTVTKREWEKYVLTLEQRPSLRTMTDFLTNHRRYLERSSESDTARSNPGVTTTSKPSKQDQPRKTTTATYAVADAPACPACKASHYLFSCKEFINLPVKERISLVQQNHLCFNCLKSKHRNANCTHGPCRKCPLKHNTLLHIERDQQKNETTEKMTDESKVITHSTAMLMNDTEMHNTKVILGTAQVNVRGSNRKIQVCRGLLDSGSQSHFITMKLCQLLNTTLIPINHKISGLERWNRAIKYKTQVQIESRHNGYKANITCLVVTTISDDMPNMVIDAEALRIPENITLADPDFDKSLQVDLLIGGEIFWDLLCVGQLKLTSTRTILQKTKLGWILVGPLAVPAQRPALDNKGMCYLVTNQQLSDQVSQFWKTEECPAQSTRSLSQEEILCESYFRDTTTRNEQGRFVVTMPLRDNVSELGESRSTALRRLLSMERRLNKDSDLRIQYTQFMIEYQNLGHMSEIPQDQVTKLHPSYYIPHHAVKKEGSTTSKIRVVFDASCPTSTGISINDAQYVGPTIQDELIFHLWRFRQNRYILAADVTKMYRQVLIQPEQRRFQLILWRENPNDEVKTFQLNTITYGMADAPYLATRCLKQISEDCQLENPRASQVIERNFYMDDLLVGVDSIHEAKELKKDLTRIFHSYGLELRKWASNERQIMEEEPKDHEPKYFQDLKDPKTLGLLWNPDSDTLSFTVQMQPCQKVTKRTILSSIARIFDPLGLISPITIRAKLLLQNLWQLKLKWDEAVPQDIYTTWALYQNQLKDLETIVIARQVRQGNISSIQIHGFCDASEKAFGACIYVRATNDQGEHTVHLLTAKSRVAPLQSVTLPRLELNGAVLLSRLSMKVGSALDIDKTKFFWWSDSEIVLHWIAGSPGRWTTFVSNRVGEIQALTTQNWHHVSTKQNPADLITRGVNPSDLACSKLWWNGPSWLAEDQQHWPKRFALSLDVLPEVRRVNSQIMMTLSKEDRDLTYLLTRYSLFSRLTRIISYCIRFIRNSRIERAHRSVGALNAEELNIGSRALIRIAQQQDFAGEIEMLRHTKPISNSKIFGLQPFLDKEGILRVGGRLKNAPIPYEQRHPIILSHLNPLASLIVRHQHFRMLHAGAQLLLAAVANKILDNSRKGIGEADHKILH